MKKKFWPLMVILEKLCSKIKKSATQNVKKTRTENHYLNLVLIILEREVNPKLKWLKKREKLMEVLIVETFPWNQ
jgi:hypothetical protein